jgi:hypothetical protein
VDKTLRRLCGWERAGGFRVGVPDFRARSCAHTAMAGLARLREQRLNQLNHLSLAHLKAATRAACSAITRALSSSGVPAGSPLISTVGLDQTGIRGQPPQLSL